MARESEQFDARKRSSHDGMLRCALCVETGADPGWCPAARSLVCDACCVALLHGDVMRLISIAAGAGRMVTPDALFAACAECERAHRHAAEYLLGDDAGAGDAPVC